MNGYTSMFLYEGRTVYVFKNGTGEISRMCTAPTNIIPTPIESNDYHIQGHLKYKNRMVFTAFELEGDHLLGVQFVEMQKKQRPYMGL